MENKINVAELLKNCPKGMELDCTMYEDVVFHDIVDRYYPIRVRRKQGGLINLNAYGCINDKIDSKCIIFPKGKTTWEGFIPPCKFKDGDIVFSGVNLISIFKCIKEGHSGSLHSYVSVAYDVFEIDKDYWTLQNIRFATEKEKEKLFKAIKDNGYNWNPKTKTLKKLVEPKFNVGDKVREKGDEAAAFTISDIDDSCYYCGKYVICNICDQDFFELVPNKFDITTLIPFESKVLVRDSNKSVWNPSFWGCRTVQEVHYRYNTVRGTYAQCIPYENNEHLMDSTEDCDEYYKTWE